MNTEEKAKAYDEALEKAKVHINSKGIGDTVDLCKYLFSELAESEDERIIRMIESFLSAYGADYFINGELREIEVWLEKQKELPFVKDVVLGYPGLYYYDGERMHFRGSPAKEELLKRGELKEQKPNIEICPHSIKSKSYKETGYPSVTRFVYNKSDEEFIRDCANILKANDYEPSAERLLSMIEQNPAWSEEDEFRLKETLEVLDESIRHLPIGYGYVTDVMNVTKWLKSLRPIWKPTEEQMEALKKVAYNLIGSGTETDIHLVQLYENLKKL